MPGLTLYGGASVGCLAVATKTVPTGAACAAWTGASSAAAAAIGNIPPAEAEARSYAQIEAPAMAA